MASLHGAFVMRDDDEVAAIQEGRQRVGEALNIGLIKRGVDFVQNAERTWTTAEK